MPHFEQVLSIAALFCARFAPQVMQRVEPEKLSAPHMGQGVAFVAAVGAESICNGELLAAVQAEDISSRGTAVWYAVDLSAESAVILSTLIAKLILILRRGLHHSGVVIIAKGARHHCRAEYSHG